jgi:hypothetical protein
VFTKLQEIIAGPIKTKRKIDRFKWLSSVLSCTNSMIALVWSSTKRIQAVYVAQKLREEDRFVGIGTEYPFRLLQFLRSL